MKTKNLLLILIIIISIVKFVNISYSCEILIKSDKNIYKVNDIAKISVILRQTHGNCIREGSAPAYKLSGIRLIHKSEFKRLNDYDWSIEYIVKILNKNAYFISYRRCPRGGHEIKYNFKL